jgi:hypothetical protein
MGRLLRGAGVVAVCMLTACGPTLADRRRLAELRTDPILTTVPAGSTRMSGIDSFMGGTGTEDLPEVGAESVFRLTVTPAEAADFYLSAFQQQGWHEITMTCQRLDPAAPTVRPFSITARRQRNGYVEVALVNVLPDSDKTHLKAHVGNAAPLVGQPATRSDGPVDTSSAPDDSCLQT